MDQKLTAKQGLLVLSTTFGFPWLFETVSGYTFVPVPEQDIENLILILFLGFCGFVMGMSLVSLGCKPERMGAVQLVAGWLFSGATFLMTPHIGSGFRPGVPWYWQLALGGSLLLWPAFVNIAFLLALWKRVSA